jgi:hypothetical protein
VSATVAAEVGRRRSRITARHIQIVLGMVWLLDGLLQLQPKMFGSSFANDVIMPSSMGQPGVVSSAITHMAHLISVQPAVVNAVFAGVQLLIGAGLLIRETVKPALVVSFAWALGVWSLGEGFGMLFTGQASPLTGAPGAAVLYAVIGLLVWPRVRRGGEVTGPAAAEGPLGARGGQAVWALLWSGSGILWLLPVNRAPGAITGALTGAASGEPGWVAHLETAASGAMAGRGTAVAVLAALLSFVIGIAPLVTRRSGVFLVAGIALSLDYWIFGQAFGQMFTGIGTDPSTGPLIILLALSIFPDRARVPEPLPATVATPTYVELPQLVGQASTARGDAVEQVAAAAP